MGEYLVDNGVRSFAVSETQKFGHVTYFLKGNNSGYITDEIENYIEIPSDNVAFDEAPAMKAQEITDATIALLRSGEYRYGRINFANGDMVGHTGNLKAAISAMEEYGLNVHRQTPEELEIWKEFISSWADEIRGGYIPVELYDTVQEIMDRKPK